MELLLVASLFLAAVSALNLEDFVKTLGEDCPTAKGPDCPADITYWFYTRSTKHSMLSKPGHCSRSNRQGVQLDTASPDTSQFSDAPLIILIHGYWNNKDSEFNTVLRSAYFEHGEYNIISVDWRNYVKVKCYYTAVQSIPTVAKCVGEFVNALHRARELRQVHVLGHSLGAHVSAWASYDITPQLQRLTRFDPALPLFQDATTKPGVADFIDVYHSNCGYAGQTAAEGTVDVYFNSMSFQPGCKCDVMCSHLIGVKYFAESVSKGGGMVAFPCHSWEDYANDRCPVPTREELATVGFNIDQTKRGRFLVFTNADPPYLINPEEYLDSDSFYHFRQLVGDQCDATDVYDMVTSWIDPK